MNYFMKNLEPAAVWKYFSEILTIPRPSGKEEEIRNYLIRFAQQHKLSWDTDQTGNLVIRKPATSGYENRPGVILQSHLDMVCEKNADVDFDFMKDPIPAYVDGDWVRSNGTTLGADDGIGIAAQMAVLAAADIPHGPLECLFTVEEETGLTGAFGLESGFLSGSVLLNLDSEDEGEIFIGCAGGVDVTAWFDYTEEPVPGRHEAWTLSVSGLKGGHSGDDIHKGLGNSIKTLVRFLWQHTDELDIRIHQLEGGNLRNAIAREARVTFTLPAENSSKLTQLVSALESDFFIEHPRTEPDARFHIQAVNLPPWVIDEDTQANLILGLYGCPHGVHAWSQTMENMVETSTNLAAVKMEDSRIKVTTSQRSSVASGKRDIANMVESVFLLAGAETRRSGGYPGWTPNPDSKLVRLSDQVYNKLFNQKPVVRAIHAGLECGLFLEKYPDLDMISFGPTIKGAHSPDERLHIESNKKFWNFLLALLKEI